MKKFSFLTVQLELKLVMGVKESVCFQMGDTNGMKLFVTINRYMLQEYIPLLHSKLLTWLIINGIV